MKYRCYGCMNECQNESGICPICGYAQGTRPENALHMLPGSLLANRYLIGKVLGFGGFGVTYIAWDSVLQQRVAIKEYLPSEFATRTPGKTEVSIFSGNKAQQFADGKNKFLEEAKRLAKFQNEPGIVRIFDRVEANNTAYIVMEYLDGETLAEFLNREKKVPIDQGISMLTPVIHSLEVVHKAGIIHRDISPDNIFITKDEHVKLIDFGAARCATTSYSRSLTVIIKPGYSPEEQYRNRGEQGPHTDVYALAAVLYRMITGETPPDALERRAFLEHKKKDTLVPPSKYCKISKNQENAILNAMNIYAESRTATAEDFLSQLQSKESIKLTTNKKYFGIIQRWPLSVKAGVLIGGLLVVAIFLLLLFGRDNLIGDIMTTFTIEESQTRVPSVVNTSVKTAQESLLDNYLKSLISGRKPSKEIPADMVLQQSIDAGKIVEKGTLVELYISAPEEATLTEGIMPNITYYSEEEATEMLSKLGAKVEVEYEPSDTVAAGVVIDASKQPGDPLSQGDIVTIHISSGSTSKNNQSNLVDMESQSISGGTALPISLNKSSLRMGVGEVANLTVTGNPPFSWTSSQPDIVKVDDGTITALRTGNATITVSSGEQEASCDIIVSIFTQAEIDKDQWLFADMITPEELTVGGKPFWKVTVEEASQVFPSEDPQWYYLDDHTQYTQKIGRNSATSATQYTGQSGLNDIYISDYSSYNELREIGFGDTPDAVLSKLGISIDGVNYCNDILDKQVLRLVNDNGNWVNHENMGGTVSPGSKIELIWPNFQSDNELIASFEFYDGMQLSRICYSFMELGY